jgi:hypothetical protein
MIKIDATSTTATMLAVVAMIIGSTHSYFPYSSLLNFSSTTLAFTYLLITVLVVCENSPLLQSHRCIVISLAIGTYMTTVLPRIYTVIGLVILFIPLRNFGLVQKCISRNLHLRTLDHQISTTMRDQWKHMAVLLFWLPTSIPIKFRVYLTACSMFCALIHLLHIFIAVRRRKPKDVIEAWVLTKEILSTPQTIAIQIITCLLWCVIPFWLFVALLTILILGIVKITKTDEKIHRDVFTAENAETINSLYTDYYPWAAYYFIGSIQEPIETYLSSLWNNSYFGAGVISGCVLHVVSFFSFTGALILYVLVCPMLYCIGDGSKAVMKVHSGVLLYISLEGMVSGYIFVYHLCWPWKWIILLIDALTWQIVFCLTAVLVYVCVMALYYNNFSFRKILFHTCIRRNNIDNNRPLILTFKNVNDIILESSLKQIPEVPVYKKESRTGSLTIRYKKSKGIDAGGLKRAWASSISRELVIPSENQVVPMMRTWEEGAHVYDVNYEYLYSELRRGKDYEDVYLAYQKLGSLFGICLKEGVQLLKLSQVLCKYLLSNDKKETHLEVTWDDLAELFPDKASKMKPNNPEHREYIDYADVTLLNETLSPEFFNITTGFKDEEFHLPSDPTDIEFNKLAQAVTMNNFVAELRAHFRLGFRSTVDCENIGKVFGAADLQHMLSKASEIDFWDWKKNSINVGAQSVIETFWESVSDLSQEDLQNLCEFATGQPTPPAGGFQEFFPRFSVFVEPKFDGIIAHTCANIIQLPNVTDKEKMKNLLRLCKTDNKADANFNIG